MEALDVDGHSRGLMTTWSPKLVCHNIKPYKDAIGSELEDPETELRFYFLNIYSLSMID